MIMTLRQLEDFSFDNFPRVLLPFLGQVLVFEAVSQLSEGLFINPQFLKAAVPKIKVPRHYNND